MTEREQRMCDEMEAERDQARRERDVAEAEVSRLHQLLPKLRALGPGIDWGVSSPRLETFPPQPKPTPMRGDDHVAGWVPPSQRWEIE